MSTSRCCGFPSASKTWTTSSRTWQWDCLASDGPTRRLAPPSRLPDLLLRPSFVFIALDLNCSHPIDFIVVIAIHISPQDLGGLFGFRLGRWGVGRGES